MKHYIRRRSGRNRKAASCAHLPLFEWAHRNIWLDDPVVRHLVRKVRVSPTLALVFAELIGLGGRHDR